MTTFVLDPAKGNTLEKWARTAPPAGIHMVHCLPGDHGRPTFRGRAHQLAQVVCRPGAVIRGGQTSNTRAWLFRNCLFEASAPVGPGNFAALFDTDDKSSDITFGTAGMGCEFRACADIGALSVADKLAMHATMIRLRGAKMIVAWSRIHECRTAVHLMGVGARVENCTIEAFTVDGVDVANSGQRVLRNTIRDGRHFPEESLHADAIQLQDTTASDILIEGNTIGPSPLADYLQGISGFDGAWSNVTIRNNDVTVKEAYHGATLFGGDGHVIEGNTIRQDGKIVPWVQIAKRKDGTPPKGCAVTGNTAPKLVMESVGVAYSGNCRANGVPLPA